MLQQLRRQLEGVARTLSMQGKPWYVCQRDESHGRVMSEENLWRYKQMGWSVVCAYWRGERYKNVYTLGGGIQTVED